MNARRLGYGVAVGVFVAAAAAGRADVVTLSDGSRLVGRVERLGEGTLFFATRFAGQLTIDAQMVTSLATDGPVSMALTTGDRLVGSLASPSGTDRLIAQTALGDIPVALHQVEAVWRAGEKSPEQTVAEARLAEARAQSAAQAGRWSATLEVGASSTEGNKETLDARGRFELRRKSDVDLLRFYASGVFSEENEVRSSAEAKGGAYYEHLLGERFLAYARTEAEYDEFENLELRYAAGVGGGYYWIKKPKHELKSLAGFGYLHESFFDGVTRDTPQLEVTLDYTVELNDWLKLTHSANYYPTFEAVRDYRLVFDTAFVVPLGKSDVWKLKLGALHEYDPIPQLGRESLDQMYYANILLDLK